MPQNISFKQIRDVTKKSTLSAIPKPSRRLPPIYKNENKQRTYVSGIAESHRLFVEVLLK